jgi:hypothetical protein
MTFPATNAEAGNIGSIADATAAAFGYPITWARRWAWIE